MCGIWGFNSKTDSPISPGAIQRGLDGSFQRASGNVTFGHSLLSISTRSSCHAAESLPILSHNYLFTYNGEIFEIGSNYIAADDTSQLIKSIEAIDSESLQSKLPELLNSLNGFFAFSLYAKSTNTIYLVRDRFGQKPLYYATKSKTFYFSSSALDCLDWYEPYRKYSAPTVHENKGGGLYLDEENPFPDIYQVPPGHFVCIPLNRLPLNPQTVQWYEPVVRQDAFKPISHNYFKDATENLHELLIRSVKLRSTSDAIISLSGGIDSTLLAGIHTNKVNPLPVYTLDVAEEQFNELNTVKSVATRLGLPLHIVDNSVTTSDLVRGIHLLELPSFNFSFSGFINFYREISNTSRVCIEGHGADELFGGYPNFIRQLIIDYSLRGRIAKSNELLASFRQTSKLSNSKTLSSLAKGVVVYLKNRANTNSLLGDFFSKSSLPMVLRTFDRIQMQAGIEGRSPFLDYRVVEFLQMQPLDFLFYRGQIKAPLKYLLDTEYNLLDLLPKKKIGFTSSYNTVLKLSRQLSLGRYSDNSRLINQSQIFDAVMSLYPRDTALTMKIH